MNTTFKNLKPAASYALFPAAQVGPWVDARTLPPFAPISTTAADATGALTLDLTPRIEYALVGPDPSRSGETMSRRALVSTTRGGTP